MIYTDLSTYFEAFEKGYEVVANTGWTFATEAVHNLYILELESKKMQNSDSYKVLKMWKKGESVEVTRLGKEVLNEKYKAYVFLKRAGF